MVRLLVLECALLSCFMSALLLGCANGRIDDSGNAEVRAKGSTILLAPVAASRTDDYIVIDVSVTGPADDAVDFAGAYRTAVNRAVGNWLEVVPSSGGSVGWAKPDPKKRVNWMVPGRDAIRISESQVRFVVSLVALTKKPIPSGTYTVRLHEDDRFSRLLKWPTNGGHRESPAQWPAERTPCYGQPSLLRTVQA